MELGGLVQTLFPKKMDRNDNRTLFSTVPSTPIHELSYYNMSTAVSESKGISNEQFRIGRVKEVYPDYNPQKIISDSEARIPEARKAEYSSWRASLNMDGNDYDYAAAFMSGTTKKGGNGHLDDSYKLPHHMSFNKFSQYSKDYGKVAGSWTKDNKSSTGWSFSESKNFKTSIETLYKNTPDKYKKQYYKHL